MEHYRIRGGKPLKGTVQINGAKNAVLPILAAVVLTKEVCIIENIPDISDVTKSFNILTALGATIEYDREDGVAKIDPSGIHTHVVPRELAHSLRGSYYYLGALLSRFGKAESYLPGGCDFGERPIDLHLKGFRALGAEAPDPEIDSDCVTTYFAEELLAKRAAVKVEKRSDDRIVDYSHLETVEINMEKVSVGATLNVMLAAACVPVRTVIYNAAREPHIVSLAVMMDAMGADVRGAGTDTIRIVGNPNLKGVTHSVIPDQIEAGTYMVAAAATGGDVRLECVIPEHLRCVSSVLLRMGVKVEEDRDEEAVRVYCDGPLRACDVHTDPYPSFPTDMQPQVGALMAIAKGTSHLTENVWAHRFQYLDQLEKMGAQVSISDNGRTATFIGVDTLRGAKVKAKDLRAGAAMVIAAMSAQGESLVGNIQFIERGYQNIVEKLTALGADIQRVDVPDEA